MLAQDLENKLALINFTCGSIFIECGKTLFDRPAIERGVSIFEAFVGDSDSPAEMINQARYNLANGYGGLALWHEKAQDSEARLKAWLQQRSELQQILLSHPEDIPDSMLPQILTNYAATLSELGRTSEALDYLFKVLELCPTHPVALGTAGEALFRLLNIQPVHNTRLMIRSWELLTAALSDPQALQRMGDGRAQQSFKRSLEVVERAIASVYSGQLPDMPRLIAEAESAHGDWQAPSEQQYWSGKHLLLTLNPYPQWCPHTVVDDIFFDGIATTADENGEQRFQALAHTMNQIKEDYAVARYELYLSQNGDRLEPISKLTYFADTGDYADFGLSAGLLKSSMRRSIDILDKVANFLNRYLELDIPDRHVSFASIWYEKGRMKGQPNAKLQPIIDSMGWMRGIKDVAETLNVFPAPSKDIRNKATHDFVLIENLTRPKVMLNGRPIEADAYELAEQFLRMAKGVIVNTIAVVQRTEGMREEDSQGVIVSRQFRYTKGISDQLNSSDT